MRQWSAGVMHGEVIVLNLNTFSVSARSVGFIFDSKLSTKKQVIKICQAAYFDLKCICSIRFLTEDAAKTLVTSYVLSKHFTGCQSKTGLFSR